jgi:hypothetical protein
MLSQSKNKNSLTLALGISVDEFFSAARPRDDEKQNLRCLSVHSRGSQLKEGQHRAFFEICMHRQFRPIIV